MTDNNQGYKKTGKNVTVSKDDIVNATIERLMEYDSMQPDQKSGMVNPYNDPVNVKVGGKKMVQVPRYVQNVAIKKWLSLKRRADMNGLDGRNDGRNEGGQNSVNSSHTRIANRSRYASQDRDPFVMNRDLRGVEGALDDDREMNEFTDYPIDRELKKLYDYEKSSRHDVGQSRVPDDRYGRGGSYGDLPRDFEIFSRGVERNLDDAPYDDGAPRGIEPNGFYEQHDSNDLHYLSDYDDRLKRSVRQGERRSMNRGSATNVKPSFARAHDNMDPIQGMDPDIHSEKHTIETPGIENYAPVDFSVDSTAHQVNNYEGDCLTCSKGGDGDTFRGQVREVRDFKPMYDRRSSRNDSDMDEDDYGFDYDDQDGDNGVDSPVYGDDRLMNNIHAKNNSRWEHMDDEDDSNDPTYKYLFFILLFVMIFSFAYYKRNEIMKGY